MFHRFLTASLVSLSIAATFGCSSPSQPTQAVADSGQPDSPETDGDVVVAPPENNRAFFEAAAAPLCERIYNCCMTPDDRLGVLFLFGVEAAPVDVAACTTELRSKLAEFDAIASSSINAGRLKFVPEEAAACLAQMEQAKGTCAGMFTDGLPTNYLACPKAYQPLVAAGGSCIMASECIDSACRPTDATRTKASCQPKGKEGEFCLGNESCEPGLVCSQLIDDACVGSSKASVCRKPGAKGTRCCSADDCATQECGGESTEEPRCTDPLPSQPAPDSCTGVAPDAGADSGK